MFRVFSVILFHALGVEVGLGLGGCMVWDSHSGYAGWSEHLAYDAFCAIPTCLGGRRFRSRLALASPRRRHMHYNLNSLKGVT